MSYSFEKSSLWNRTLAPQKGRDALAKEREKLRAAYFSMRDNAAELVKLIQRDCPELTVHDVTHLDALWEIADVVAGDDFEMNPVEAFVFGAAVLLHDSAMTVAAFPGGMSEITSTTEWSDAAYAAFRRRGIKEPPRDKIYNPPNDLKDEVLFHVLRALHAKQAEELISVKWPLPSGDREICLLEDADLQLAYGKTIGRIAHSHHWDIDQLTIRFRDNVGAAPDLPSDWTLNEIKVACLLRCSDAAHIDRRRAPSMLYALTSPSGISALHWNFQNKLQRPVVDSNSLVYCSGEDFSIDEAPSWWLCFDTIKMINGELSKANAVLLDIGAPGFAAKSVRGAESPAMLAHSIRPSGWRPIDAQVKVSNPIQLAQTLGGRHLYGRGGFAPIRELLQNAIDAVRARRQLEERPITWGKISLTLEKLPTPADGSVWLHIDDNGVGMSERVLTGPLLDFGRSLWNSYLLQEEFPGLESRGVQPIGKFGIGFFSVFLLGQHLKVITKPYKGGSGDARALEFSSIESRPILREAGAGELPTDVSTRVSVRIDDLKSVQEVESIPEYVPVRYSKLKRNVTINEILSSRIRQLISAVDVEIEVYDKINNHKYTHNPDWENINPSDFLDELLSIAPKEQREIYIRSHEALVSNLKDESGNSYGRAALMMYSPSDRDLELYTPGSFVSVGGLVHPAAARRGEPQRFGYVGVLSGDTDEVSRRAAFTDLPENVVSEWASRQASLIEKDRYLIYDVVSACHTIFSLGGITGDLPFCFSEGDFINYEKFRIIVSSEEKIYIPIVKKYDENFEFLSIRNLRTPFFLHETIRQAIVIEQQDSSRLFASERAKEIFDDLPGDISYEDLAEGILPLSTQILFDEVSEIWDGKPRMEIDKRQLFEERLHSQPTDRWVLILRRPN